MTVVNIESGRKTAEPMLVLDSLTKTFEDAGQRVHAISDFSLTVGAGEWLTLLGPSGCGKSTTLRCVAGLESADTGQIRIAGDLVFSGEGRISKPPNKRPISMVFQSYAIWPHLSVVKNVAFPLETQRLARAMIDERANAAMRMVGIESMASRDATRLSGGQQQRVALARAIVKNSALLLLDEPLSNLDAKLRLEMRSELRLLRDRIGMTTLHVTHDQEEALSLADRIVLLNAGKVVETGTPDDLYHRPKEAFTAEFLGGAELWSADRVEMDGEAAMVTTASGLFRAGNHDGTADGGPRRLMIRPENIVLTRPGDAPAEGNTLSGTIARRMFTGRRAELTITTGNRVVHVDRPSVEPWEIGDEVVLWLPPERCVVVRDSLASASGEAS